MKYLSKTSRAIIFTCSILLLLITGAPTAWADVYQVNIFNGSTPVESVNIFGNYGVNDLAGRFTGANGSWTLNTIEIDSPSPSITFVKNGFVFEPAELVVSPQTCPSGVCSVRAIRDSLGSAIIHWTVVNSRGAGVAGIPVVAPKSYVGCPKTTDTNGYVFFAVPRHAGSCSNSDTDLENNFYSVLPLEPEGTRCTFTSRAIQKHKVCTDEVSAPDGSVYGSAVASCSSVTPLVVGSSVSYSLQVQLETNAGQSGVTFEGSHGVSARASRQVDGTGKWTITTAQLGVAANTEVTLVPTGDFEFFPSELVLSPNSCAGNLCKIWAVKNGSKSGVVRWTVKEGSNPKSGVPVASANSLQCGGIGAHRTDSGGAAFFSSIVSPSCSDSDAKRTNNYLKYIASPSGCSVSHNSATPFQICPTSTVSTGELYAQCGGSPQSGQQMVSGRIQKSSGLGSAGVTVLSEGAQSATTDSDGRFTLFANSGASLYLTPSAPGRYFQPSRLSIVNLSQNYSGILFAEVDSDTSIPTIPASTPQCAASSSYQVSGVVFDLNGNRLAGVKINNHQVQVATSNQYGFYSFSVAAGSDNWVTAEFGSAFFDPEGVALVNVFCPQENINFKVSEIESHTLSGRALDDTGAPIAGSEITLTFGDEERKTSTNDDGGYIISVPDGAEFSLAAAQQNYSFEPSLHVGVAQDDIFELDFIGTYHPPVATPTPTPAPTASPTHAPTATATPLPTATAAPTTPATPISTPTLAPSPTYSPTSAPSAAPTPPPAETAAPTSTPVFTTPVSSPTVTPTAVKTPTPSPTATTTPTRTPTPAPTIIPTPVPTVSATATPTISATPTPTPEPGSRASVESWCSEDPTTSLRWRVTNHTFEDLTISWEISDTNQSGSMTIPAYDIGFFDSVPLNSEEMWDVAIIRINGEVEDIDIATLEECVAPTPAPTASPTPTDVTLTVLIPELGKSENYYRNTYLILTPKGANPEDCTAQGIQAVTSMGVATIRGLTYGAEYTLYLPQGRWEFSPAGPINVTMNGSQTITINTVGVRAPAQTAFVEGRVTNNRNIPVPGALVDLGPYGTQVTDENGAYLFPNLPYFHWGMPQIVTKAGFHPSEYFWDTNCREGCYLPRVLTAQACGAKPATTLPTRTTISTTGTSYVYGKIKYTNGTPYRHDFVYLVPEGANPLTNCAEALVQSIVVHDGSFMFGIVQPGIYYVMLPNQPKGMVTNPPLPLRVEVKPGQNVSVEVEVSNSGNPSTILGIVTSGKNVPLSGVEVEIPGYGITTTNEIGAYYFNGTSPVVNPEVTFRKAGFQTFTNKYSGSATSWRISGSLSPLVNPCIGGSTTPTPAPTPVSTATPAATPPVVIPTPNPSVTASPTPSMSPTATPTPGETKIEIVQICVDSSSSDKGDDDDDDSGHSKVTICHLPPGNPSNAQTLSVGQSAVSAHLAHGDYLGECQVSAPVNLLRWKIVQTSGSPASISWNLLGATPEQTGSAAIEAGNSVGVTTTQINGSNTLTASIAGVEVARTTYSSSFCQAQATPSPTPEVTKIEVTQLCVDSSSDKGDDDDDDNSGSGKKVTLCHLPPGNPENPQTLSVGQSAVSAHLAHGDYLGECLAKAPTNIIRWKITQLSGASTGISWNLLGANPVQGGTESLESGKSVGIVTTQIGGANTIVVSIAGVEAARATYSSSYCQVAATPTPTPTKTPTPIPTTTPTRTPTPTPVVQYVLAGDLYSRGKKDLSTSVLSRLKRLPAGSLQVKVVSVSNPAMASIVKNLTETFDYEVSVPAGNYRISLLVPDQFVVKSRPKIHELNTTSLKGRLRVEDLSWSIAPKERKLTTKGSTDKKK